MEKLPVTDREKLKHITYIEDRMNRIMRMYAASEAISYKYMENASDISSTISAVNDKLKRISKSRKDLAMVEEHMRLRGYVREDGSLDYPRFQLDGDIGQSVWSRYETGSQNRSSHDTLLKIILALKLNESEARTFLTYAGSGFAITDKVDLIVLSYIMTDYLGDDKAEDIVATVSFLLNFYSEQEVKAGRSPLRTLYKM